MDRSNSTSFQPVEDWLRSLGLLQYAQSFYDNGYEDIETVKLMGEPDLDVINVTSERDRDDILSAVIKLRQNLYFELEVDSAERDIPREKIEPILLKSKLKECLKKHNVQLIEPPYYNPDGTLGDLYPLAIRFAEELCTFFDDVLEALEQLRKRQLPVQSYDQMVNLPVNNNEDPSQKRRSMTISDPPEYLDCETSNKTPMRTYSFSKYDTRVTKSTTDLSKGLQMADGLRSSKGKGGKKIDRNKSIFASVFKRNKEGTKSVRDNRKSAYDFNAVDVTLSQDEIVTLMAKVKKKEISQEDVLAEVKKAGLSKSNSSGLSKSNSTNAMRKLSPSSSPENTMAEKQSLSRKGKLSKSMIKKASVPTSQFYTKDEEHVHSSTSLQSSEDSNSIGRGHNRSGSVHSESPPDSIRSSPELGKPGLFKSIRNSLRKKGKTAETACEKGHSPSSSTSSQENLMYNTDTGAKAEMSPKDFHKAIGDSINKNLSQIKKPLPPPIPRRVDRMSAENSKTVDKFSKHDVNEPDDDVFGERQSSLRIKSYEKYQEETTRRRSSDKGHSSDVNIQSNTTAPDANIRSIGPSSLHAKPQPPPRNTKGSREPSQRKPPPRPKPSRTGSSNTIESKLSSSSSSSIETASIDEIGNQMNKLIAGLNDHLSQLNEKKQLSPTSSGEEKSNKPLLPPRLPKKRLLDQKTSSEGGSVTKPLPPANKPGQSDKFSFQNELNKSVSAVGKVSHELEQSSQDGKPVHSLGRVQNVSLKQIISKKLRKEAIQLQTGPYTTSDGRWNIPYPLLERYANELQQTINETIKAFEEIRVAERSKRSLSVVSVVTSAISRSAPISKGLTLDQWLVAIGLPMFCEDLGDVEISTILEVSKLSEDSFKRIGVFDDKHVSMLLTKAREYVRS